MGNEVEHGNVFEKVFMVGVRSRHHPQIAHLFSVPMGSGRFFKE